MNKREKRNIKRQMQALAFLCVLLIYPLCAVDFGSIGNNSNNSIQSTGRKDGQSLETGGMEEGREEESVGEDGAEEKGMEGKGEEEREENEPGPAVAITFDDGPSAEWTPILLDGLKERGVKATFFVIGKNVEKEGNSRIIERMHDEGHLIGNHTYGHVNLSKMSREEAHKELDHTDGLIREITGAETAFVRPPFGAFPGDMEEELDKLYVKWTVDPLDWTTENADEIVQRVVTDTEENDIILLHDCYESSVKAALRIIDILQAQGYEFVTVDRLLID